MNRQQQDFPPEIEQAASGWVVRMHDADFRDWDAFTVWLEASPDHLPAYEAVLARVDRAAIVLQEAAPAAPVPDNDIDAAAPRAPRRRWFQAGAAIAASIAVVIGLGFSNGGFMGWNAGSETIATAAGERRVIDLPDGSRIILNGDTNVAIDSAKPRHIELAHGEVLFEVRHDKVRPFVVMAGGVKLLDVGTVFNVVADQGRLDVAVAEGAVIYQPDKDAVRLNPGDGLSRAAPGAAPVLRQTSPQAIGAWQRGQLHYDGVALDQIARDLERNLGPTVKMRGRLPQARFTGTLTLNGSPEQVFNHIGPLLGVRFTPGSDGWTMSPLDDPPR